MEQVLDFAGWRPAGTAARSSRSGLVTAENGESPGVCHHAPGRGGRDARGGNRICRVV